MLIKQLDSCGERWGKKIEHNYKRRHFTLLMTLFFGKGGGDTQKIECKLFQLFHRNILLQIFNKSFEMR